MRQRVVPRDLTMSAPDIGERDRALVAEVMSSTQLSFGPMVERFETGIAAVARRKHAIAVSSGTAGLHVAVRALGLGHGDSVITTSFSFVASTNCLLYEGARPVFADIDPVTFNIDPSAVEDVVQSSGAPPVGLIPVDVFGQPCDLARLEEIARRNGFRVIEDACEAIGATWRGRPAGSLGQMAVFAFYPNKQMTTGEGGVIVTDDDELADVARSLRNQGRGAGNDWLTHLRLGFNYRLDELSAALGVAQLERLDALIAQRDDVARRYSAALADIPGIAVPRVLPATTRMSWFVYVVLLDRGLSRDLVAAGLAARHVPTRPYFSPIHLQPYFRDRFGDLRGTLPVTEDVGQRTLALPFHGHLSDESIGYVAEALRETIAAS
ncbi:MAG TPA: DegT/DnrJ/EryC1/StrS family aminotransferase [Candidatus Limnocylindria bacterium]|nr:DegT/DnrJ/EryC1/StrS family aminotransferase [Candidatus Limnocylindria bacterium]